MAGPGNALKVHLSAFVEMTPADQELLERILSRQVRRMGARKDIISEGENPRVVNVLLDGWAVRYKQLADGRRQILAFLIPGDLCDANVFILKQMDHSLGSLTPITYAEISQADFEEIMERSPRVTKALWWSELVNIAVQREWTTNIGQRTAYERIAHLYCEVYVRWRVAGLVRDGGFQFPLTQTDIADATGMTAVHVNRTLQQLRRDGLLEFRNRWVSLPDAARLMEVALFNPNYLHLEHRS
jgi:CRP-like cAMP-binding protein